VDNGRLIVKRLEMNSWRSEREAARFACELSFATVEVLLSGCDSHWAHTAGFPLAVYIVIDRRRGGRDWSQTSPSRSHT